MDSFFKRCELAGRRTLVRLLSRKSARHAVSSVAHTIPLDANGARILMLRQDRIGDVLVSLPVIHALKRRFPSAQIDAFFGENNHFVAMDDPAIAERFVYHKNIFQSWKTLRILRWRRYDYLIDFMDNVSASSTVFVARIRAGCSIGIEKENTSIYDIVVPRLSQGRAHIVERLGELLRPFGISPESEDLHLSYPLAPQPIERARRWFVTQFGERSQAARIGVNISASGEDKQWGNENFIAVIHELHGAFPPAGFTVFCAPGEESRAALIADATGAHVFPSGTFDEFAAGIRELDMLLTIDTSAVHLAAAFQVPAVVLYVHDNPALAIWTPYLSPNRAVTTPEHSVRNITPQQVVSAVFDLEREFHCCSRSHLITV